MAYPDCQLFGLTLKTALSSCTVFDLEKESKCEGIMDNVRPSIHLEQTDVLVFIEQCKNLISLQLYMMVVHTELSQFILVSVILTVSRSQQHQTVQTESRITWHVLIWSSLIFICLIQSTHVTVKQSVKFGRMLNAKTGLGISCLALLVTQGV